MSIARLYVTHTVFAIIVVSVNCDTRDSVQPVSTKLGENITLVCHLNGLKRCHHKWRNFYRVDKDQTSVLVHRGSHRFTLNVRSLNDATKYYCTEECIENTDQDGDKKCWFHITSKKVV